MLLSLPSILGYYQQLPLIYACMDFEGMFKTSPADSEFVTRKEIIDRRVLAQPEMEKRRSPLV